MKYLDILALLFLFLVFPFWAFTMISSLRFRYHVVPQALREWGERNGFHLEEKRERPYFIGNPFWRDSSSSQAVLRITVRAQSGKVRKGWLRLGGPRWFALSASRCPVEIRWDDDDPSPKSFSTEVAGDVSQVARRKGTPEEKGT